MSLNKLFNLFEAESLFSDNLPEKVTDSIDVVELDVADDGEASMFVYLREGEEGQVTQNSLPETLDMNGQRINLHFVPAKGLN